MCPGFTVFETGTSLDCEGDKKNIICFGVPSHVHIRGNEKAGSAAKSALDLPCLKVGVLYTDFKHISQYILSIWPDAVANKLHQIGPGIFAVL